MRALSAGTRRAALDLVDRRSELARNESYPKTTGALTIMALRPSMQVLTTALRSTTSAANSSMQVLTTALRSTTSAANTACTL
jgi:hypothetical protein